MNGEDVDAMTDFSTSSKIYKSKWLDDWEKRSFSAVSYEIYYLVFCKEQSMVCIAITSVDPCSSLFTRESKRPRDLRF
jgi:hypothetical protein